MSKAKKVLTNQLAAVIKPHLGSDELGNLPPKAVAKTLRKLAKQVRKQPKNTAKASQPKALSAAKQARKALFSELTDALQPYLGTADMAENSSKAITKTIKRLATVLAKQRRKQSKQAAKATRLVASGTVPLLAAAPEAARITPPAPARRPTTKRPALKAAPAAATAGAGEA